MASHDALVLTPRAAGLEKQRETIVMVRWALILTCAYLMLVSKSTAGPVWLGPLLIAAFLGSNLFVGRTPRDNFSQQPFKVAIAVMDTLFITASLFVAQQLSVELLLLCLGVLVMAIAGLRLGVIATVTIGLTLASLALQWATGTQVIWQSSMLLRVPFLLGAALVFALLVEGQGPRRSGSQPSSGEDLLDSLTAHVTQQNDAIRRCSAAMADGATSTARSALEDVMLHNRQMAQALGRFQPLETARAA
jgi:hypothetical protein